MASPDLTAGTVMNAAAALLNDVTRTVYTYAVQLPYLNMALQELQELFELNEVPVTDTVSAVIQIDAGVSSVGYAPTPPIAATPYLPDDLIEPQILWTRTRDIDPYVPMNRVDFLPRWMEGTEISQLTDYVWQTQQIKFFPANGDNDIKLDYIRNLFTAVTSSASDIAVVNAASFLEYRTAGLLAEFVELNKIRADNLTGFASLAMDRAVGIGTKGRQVIITRRRPFRSSYKRRSFM
jgi:hypothetical protein